MLISTGKELLRVHGHCLSSLCNGLSIVMIKKYVCSFESFTYYFRQEPSGHLTSASNQ